MFARRLLLNRWAEPFIDVRTAVRYGPNHMRASDTMKAAVDVLVKHGWLLQSERREIVNGSRAGKSWKVVRD